MYAGTQFLYIKLIELAEDYFWHWSGHQEETEKNNSPITLILSVECEISQLCVLHIAFIDQCVQSSVATSPRLGWRN